MNNDQTIGKAAAFYVDVRDGTVEQHLSNGEVKIFPPSNGKSISPLMVDLHDARHTLILGATSDGKRAFRPAESTEPPKPNGSRLLAVLLSRQ